MDNDSTSPSLARNPAGILLQGTRALLVTAPAGVGKSRLRHEFLRRIEREEQRVLVLLGRGDPMGSGACRWPG
jgi:hypothetical protein